jgi:CO/xanthine dehydrogenase Mo-binding subunit
MDGSASPFRAPVAALDGPDKVTGAARYTFDFGLPGMLHAKVLRSPHPHARIRSIDTSRAEALPGVAAVVTGVDATRLPDPYYGVAIRDQPVVAIDKVRYVGDMVAAVAAVDEETAYRALGLIDVQYEMLPAVMSIEEALAELPLQEEEVTLREQGGKNPFDGKENAADAVLQFHAMLKSSNAKH